MPSIDAITRLRPFVDELNNITSRWLYFLEHSDDEIYALLAAEVAARIVAISTEAAARIAALATETAARQSADAIQATALVAHAAESDPHPAYQKESEKNQNSGYAGLTSAGKLMVSQQVKLDELATPTDITTLNATTGLHGLLPKLTGQVSRFLNGNGGWTVPVLDELAAPSDITDLNATTLAHGLMPKLPSGSDNYLNGDGGWSPLPTGANGSFTADGPVTVTVVNGRITDIA